MDTPAPLRIRVTRDILAPTFTLGSVELSADGGDWLPFGWSCEDTDRRVEEDITRKIKGKTAIPIGTYEVELYDSPKHGAKTPQLVSVPGFRHIQIHSGNRHEHTEGCLLFGLTRDVKMGTVAKSRAACDWLQGKIIEVVEAGGVVTVEVRRA